MSFAPLPIDEVLPRVLDALAREGACVITAPPGSGKTTRVPGAVLDAGLAGGGAVRVLQPRRVAARLAAARIARERGVPLGGEVGYQVRFERRAGPDTRIELLTEGLLLRRMQDDPSLEGTGCVILDELHERSLHLDLALALLVELRRDLRPDLKLVAMSATLDAAPLARFLGDCPVISAEGRLHPVELEHLGETRPEDLPRAVARALRRGPAEGHALVFLPGQREIHEAQLALEGFDGAEVLPLHASLPVEAQARALAPSPRRKVVLATNLAETSVTLEGVGLVIDSGLARVPRLDPATGLDRLDLVRISAASAAQRAGRAGRTGPGVCLRLWSAAEQERLRPFEEPELARVDLSGAALQLYAWGVPPRRFGWFEAPPEAALALAEATLVELGALDGGVLTPLGRRLAALPLPPRLGAVVLAGRAAGCLEDAAGVAALASEPDPFDDPTLDLRERLRRLRRGRGGARLARARQVAEALTAAARSAPGPAAPATEAEDEALVAALLAGFPGRLGQRRGGGERVKLASGQGARLLHPEQVGLSELVLAVDLAAPPRGAAEALVRLAVPVDPARVPARSLRCLDFDRAREAVDARVERRFGALVLSSRPDPEPPAPDAVARVLAEAAARAPERALTLDGRVQAWLARLRSLADWMPELGLPRFEDPAALLPELALGRRSFAELRAVDLVAELSGRLTWPQRQALDAEAPAALPLPTGRPASLRYVEGQPPVLSARIQQLFGLAETPRVAGGRVAVLVELLAPNGRPAQLTADLASFWTNTYPEVRRELRGRYPKHDWPEDPRGATPRDRPGRPR